MDKPTCTIDGCAKKVHCKGLCPMHYQRRRKTGSLEKPPSWWERPRAYPACSVAGCDALGNRKGMCDKHYKREWHEANWQRTYAKAKARRNAKRDEYLADGRAYYRANRERILSQQRRAYLESPEVFRERTRRYRAADPEATRARRQREYVKNKAKYRARSIAYYQSNRDAVLARNRAYREANAETLRQSAREWRKRNSLRRKEAEMRRRALMRGNKVTKADYAAILAEHGMFCHICSLVIVDESDLHFDHVIPLALGGPHHRDNIKPAHALCNVRKGARVA